MTVVLLSAVVEALDWQSDEIRSFLDPQTGEIITFNEDEARLAESGEWASAPVWTKDLLPRIQRALHNDRMLALPDRAHIDEWRMMQNFAEQDDQCCCRAELVSTCHGQGAFRSFKDAIERLGLEQSWHAYRHAAFERVARQWLDENNIPYR